MRRGGEKRGVGGEAGSGAGPRCAHTTTTMGLAGGVAISGSDLHISAGISGDRTPHRCSSGWIPKSPWLPLPLLISPPFIFLRNSAMRAHLPDARFLQRLSSHRTLDEGGQYMHIRRGGGGGGGFDDNNGSDDAGKKDEG